LCRKKIVVRKGHLFTEAGAAKHDEAVEDAREAKIARETTQRFIDGRVANKKFLRDIKGLDLYSGIEIDAPPTVCSVCRGMDKRVIAVDACTVDDLPPYPKCEYDIGCRADYSGVLKPQTGRAGFKVRTRLVTYSAPRSRKPRRESGLAWLVIVVLTALAWIGWRMIRR
jgi:hypothetical protein